MTDLIRADIQSLQAYQVPDAQGLIKLDAMENPYALPAELKAELGQRLAQVEINRYPDPQAQVLKSALRRVMKIPAELDILLGNGSDELIQILQMAVAGDTVLSVAPSFVMYQMIAQFCRLRYVEVPLLADFNLDLPAMLRAIEKYQPSLIFLAYPNNPSGNLFRRQDIEAIIAAAPGWVVIDEAYSPFAADSWLPDVVHHQRLLLLRTLSKLGLAGLRLGYLIGAPTWLHELNKIRMPYNINALSQEAARFALEHQVIFEQQAAWIKRDRQQLTEALQNLPLTVYPSEANFILVRTASGEAKSLFDYLLGQGILVKLMQGPLLTDCLRLTIGTSSENQALMQAIQNYYDEHA